MSVWMSSWYTTLGLTRPIPESFVSPPYLTGLGPSVPPEGSTQCFLFIPRRPNPTAPRPGVPYSGLPCAPLTVAPPRRHLLRTCVRHLLRPCTCPDRLPSGPPSTVPSLRTGETTVNGRGCPHKRVVVVTGNGHRRSTGDLGPAGSGTSGGRRLGTFAAGRTVYSTRRGATAQGLASVTGGVSLTTSVGGGRPGPLSVASSLGSGFGGSPLGFSFDPPSSSVECRL